MQCVRNKNQVSDVLRVRRNFKLQRVFHCPDRGHRMNRGADPAEPLSEGPSFTRVASF